MQEIYYGVAIIPAIIGITAAVKQVGLPKNWLPLTNLFLGIIISLLINGITIPALTVLVGLGYGLGANGLYSGAKATFTK